MGKGQQFIESALLAETDECIIWPYETDKDGYSKGTYNSKYLGVHRLVCRLTKGNPPTALHHAAHTCNTRACINPQHLKWATAKENCADKIKHGTHQIGEKIGTAKLTSSQIIAIWDDSREQRIIAEQYGVTQLCVSHIKTGKTWGHITAHLPPPAKRAPQRGSTHTGSVLTEDDVKRIWFDTRTQKAIASEYGVSPGTIGHIRQGKSWGWLTSKL